MVLEWWHWVVFGMTVLVVDVTLLNAYFPIWFGIGATLVGLMVWVWPGMPLAAQIVLCGVLSLLLLVLWVKKWRPKMLEREVARLLEEAGGEIVGMVGVVVRGGAKGGRLRFQRPVGGRDVWEFGGGLGTSKPGARVVVEGISEDGKLQVRHEEPESGSQ